MMMLGGGSKPTSNDTTVWLWNGAYLSKMQELQVSTSDEPPIALHKLLRIGDQDVLLICVCVHGLMFQIQWSYQVAGM